MVNKYSQCAKCPGNVCYPFAGVDDPLPDVAEAPAFCPMRRMPEVIETACSRYQMANIHEFARLASVQEGECYELDEEGLKTRIPRIEETIQFAAKCGFVRLGIAFCVGLREEARSLSTIFEKKGFEVVSVNCKVGRVPKEAIGVRGAEKIVGPGVMEPMCNPIAQAAVINEEDVDLAVMLGLCVGHDTLFMQYCSAPCTVLAVKDRVTGHNPLAALYLSKGPYYSRLRMEQPVQKRSGEGWKKVDIRSDD
ncbi:MAG TPA: DUF1847 domain-containing protein [Desulfosalsimonadaceae bacterium]|nr:DUF1847 domain-containing protein [Desulfosalsimonadaceae bacterium]